MLTNDLAVNELLARRIKVPTGEAIAMMEADPLTVTGYLRSDEIAPVGR